jgi:hypothetical protein
LSTQPPTPSPARPTRHAARTPLAFLAIAGTCVVAAGVGGYVAQSSRTAELPAVEARPAQAAPEPEPVPAASGTSPAVTRPDPVESDTVPAPTEAPPPASRPPRAASRPSEPVEKPEKVSKPSDTIATRTERASTAAPAPQAPATSQPPARTVEPAPPAPAVEAPSPQHPTVAEATPPAPVEPAAKPQAARVSISETFTIPADSVLGLELEQTVSSETAQPEDRVDARVTRDVKVDGTTVIPAGSRVRGAVTRVENGGRFKERGRIEIRFHTLVLADGDTQSISTDALFREGDNVGKKASARIGASAAGGAIIGAIFGGEKGAAIGAAAGAGAGTAVTASQKPSEARFRAGSVVTVRLTAPVSITVQQ